MPECSDPLGRDCAAHVAFEGAWCPACQALRVQYGTAEVYALAHPPAEDITANYHGGDVNSVAAHASTPEVARQILRARIIDYVREHGTVTADEVEVGLELSHQTCSPRLTELRKLGTLIDTGEKRPTRTGRQARVLALPEGAQS